MDFPASGNEMSETSNYSAVLRSPRTGGDYRWWWFDDGENMMIIWWWKWCSSSTWIENDDENDDDNGHTNHTNPSLHRPPYQKEPASSFQLDTSIFHLSLSALLSHPPLLRLWGSPTSFYFWVLLFGHDRHFCECFLTTVDSFWWVVKLSGEWSIIAHKCNIVEIYIRVQLLVDLAI